MDDNLPFKDLFFNAFQEWEKTQPKKRSTFTAFAEWLSDNSMDVKIKQQNVDSWMNGTTPKDYKFVSVLAEKLGDWIYESLNVKPPNPYLQRATRVWEFTPLDFQKKVAEEAEKYETQNLSHIISKASKQRKPRKVN